VRTFSLVLKFRLALNLKIFFYVPSFSKNFILVSRLYNDGYGFLYNGNIFSILKNKFSISGGALINGLYKIDLDPSFELNYLSMHAYYGIKKSKIDENLFILRHKRLGYISIERIKRIANDKVLNALDFTNFYTYVDCLKGKQTNKTTKKASKSLEILEIIHVDICGPLTLHA